MKATILHRTFLDKRPQHKNLPVLFLFSLLVSFFLSACGGEKTLSPEEVAEQFWSSAQVGNLDAAKQMVTWDTSDYLKYFKDDKFNIKRVDFGEVITHDSLVKIDTTLVLERGEKKDSQKESSEADRRAKVKSDIRIPTQTILVKTEGVWRVQLKQTLAEVINKTVNAAANQFNQMLQQGMQELNNAFSGSINEISKSLEEGAKELGKTLEGNAKQFGESLNQFQQELENRIPQRIPKPEDKDPSRKEI